MSPESSLDMRPSKGAVDVVLVGFLRMKHSTSILCTHRCGCRTRRLLCRCLARHSTPIVVPRAGFKRSELGMENCRGRDTVGTQDLQRMEQQKGCQISALRKDDILIDEK